MIDKNWQEKNFWREVYPKMDFEEKEGFWIAGIGVTLLGLIPTFYLLFIILK
jgi:hypothetical protein